MANIEPAQKSLRPHAPDHEDGPQRKKSRLGVEQQQEPPKQEEKDGHVDAWEEEYKAEVKKIPHDWKFNLEYREKVRYTLGQMKRQTEFFENGAKAEYMATLQFGLALGMLQSFAMPKSEKKNKIFWPHFEPLFEKKDTKSILKSVEILAEALKLQLVLEGTIWEVKGNDTMHDLYIEKCGRGDPAFREFDPTTVSRLFAQRDRTRWGDEFGCYITVEFKDGTKRTFRINSARTIKEAIQPLAKTLGIPLVVDPSDQGLTDYVNDTTVVLMYPKGYGHFGFEK